MVVVAVAGGWTWLSSTRPADPLNHHSGFGFENSGSIRVPIGQARMFAAYLLGDTPASRATITGVTLPHVRGVRLHMYALVGQPQAQFIGFPLASTPKRGLPSVDQLTSIVGRSLHPPPAVFHPRDWVLTAALVVTPTQPGCHRITGVAIHYRVGDTSFTKHMDGAISVSTGTHACYE